MGRNRTLPLSGFVAALLFVPSLAAEPVISAGSITAWNPQAIAVPVSIAGAPGIFAFQFDLAFDPAILSLSSISEGGFLPSAGSTIFVPGSIDNIVGTAIGIAGALVGDVPGAAGNGTLVDLRFAAVSPGTSAVTVSNVILLGSGLNEIPSTTAAGSVVVDTTIFAPEPGLSWVVGLALGAVLRAAVAMRARRIGR